MIVIFFFFGEDVAGVQFAIALKDGGCIVSYVFASTVFIHLEVMKAFCGHVMAPFNSQVVIIVYWDGARCECVV